jgi:hypothetical protein
MNPVTKIVFIRKILSYVLKFNESEIGQLELYLGIDDNWDETIIDYSNLSWNWGQAAGYNGIKSSFLWEMIAKQKDSEWFGKYWNKEVKYGCVVWHLAVQNIMSNKFWEMIVEKNEDAIFKFWNQKNEFGATVWDRAVRDNYHEGIRSEIFWEYIAQKPDSFFEKYWNQKGKDTFFQSRSKRKIDIKALNKRISEMPQNKTQEQQHFDFGTHKLSINFQIITK